MAIEELTQKHFTSGGLLARENRFEDEVIHRQGL